MTTKNLLDNFRRLESVPEHTGAMKRKDRLKAIAGRKGVAVSPPTQGGTGGGGVASPLVEVEREYYDTVDYVPDGAFITFRLRPVKSVLFEDADGNGLEMQYKDYTQDD